MNDSGSSMPCFWKEFQIRELLPLAAKWSPFEPLLATASEEMMVEKTELMRVMRSRPGKSDRKTSTPGPERRMWCHSSWSAVVASALEYDRLERS